MLSLFLPPFSNRLLVVDEEKLSHALWHNKIRASAGTPDEALEKRCLPPGYGVLASVRSST
jgi:hypothetical protein